MHIYKRYKSGKNIGGETSVWKKQQNEIFFETKDLTKKFGDVTAVNHVVWRSGPEKFAD